MNQGWVLLAVVVSACVVEGDPGEELESVPAAATCPLTYYLAPHTANPPGRDENSGAASAPLRTFMGVQSKLLAFGDNKPACDVWVRVAPGTYTGNPDLAGEKVHTQWWYEHPAPYRIYFVPASYGMEGAADPRKLSGTRPIFDGRYGSKINPNYFFKNTSRTRMSFRYLQAQYFVAGGILLGPPSQYRKDETMAVRDNDIWGMYFARLGNKLGGTGVGFGGITLDNADDNLIQNNWFVSLENRDPDQDLIHALYIAYRSSGNVVQSNHFRVISGDAVKVRDFSNDNQIFGNSFERTGARGFYLDWYCDYTKYSRCTSSQLECPSWNNVFQDNTLVSGYSGAAIPVVDFSYEPAGGECYIPSWCDDRFLETPPSVRVIADGHTNRDCAP